MSSLGCVGGNDIHKSLRINLKCQKPTGLSCCACASASACHLETRPEIATARAAN